MGRARGRALIALVVFFAFVGAAFYVGRRRAEVAVAPRSVEAPAAEENAAPARPVALAAPKAQRGLPTVPIETEAPSPPATPDPKTAEEQAAAARKERDRTLQQLRDSGPDNRNLLADVTAMSNQWKKIAAGKSLDVTFGAWECHRAGCAVSTFQDGEGTANGFTEGISHTNEFMVWNGGKMRSGLIPRPDGKIEVTWVLFAPPPGQPVSQMDPAFVPAPRSARPTVGEPPRSTPPQ